MLIGMQGVQECDIINAMSDSYCITEIQSVPNGFHSMTRGIGSSRLRVDSLSTELVFRVLETVPRRS